MAPTTVLSNWSAMILPVAVLAVLAAFLPLWLARRLPESMVGLGVNLLISSGVLLFICVLYFAKFYVGQDIQALAVVGEHAGAVALHLTRLGMMTALIWGPIVLAVLAMQPQRWRPEV